MLHGSQRTAGFIALVLLGYVTAPTSVTGASVRSSAYFTVLAPTQRLADMVVGHADVFRSQVAAEWFRDQLPERRQPATIFVQVDPQRSYARTLLRTSSGRPVVWLVGSEQAVTEHLLHHEVAHLVLAERLGPDLPDWANEGIASRYDNARRHQIRQQQLATFVAQDSWPRLDRLFDAPVRQPWQYAAAVSVTDFLLDRGGPGVFCKFLDDGPRLGWQPALRRHYDLNSFAQLQTEWQQAVRQSAGNHATASAPTAAAARSFR